MPEYLAPGVYVEEVSFRSKSVEGVSTTTTGFVGPTRFGPIDLEPEVLTSLAEFERIYGDRQKLKFGGTLMHNYMWHAARAFFEEGGKRLYVARVFSPLAGAYPPADLDAANAPQDGGGAGFQDGHARARVPTTSGTDAAALRIRSRFPGAAGNLRVRLTLRLGQSVLGGTTASPTVGSLRHRDVVFITDITSPVTIGSPPGTGAFYVADSFFDANLGRQNWRFLSGPTLDPAGALPLSALTPNADPALGDQVRVVTMDVTVTSGDGGSLPSVWSGLALDPTHEIDGSPDSLTSKFAPRTTSLAQARTLPIVITRGGDVSNGLRVLSALGAHDAGLMAQLANPLSSDADRSIDILLVGGNDGLRPGAGDYEGKSDDAAKTKTGLQAFEDVEDISIVAAPGSTFGFEDNYRGDATTIVNQLISHATRMRYRIAVIDSGDGQAISEVRAMRARIDSSYAALYYPWVRVLDPVTRTEINLPPSGFVAGIYARNDVNRAVYKAPANEVVNLAIGFETFLNKGQQDVLNPEGINCFRYFEGRGHRLWGARTASSDPEWKYVNLRRYFAYLERSIDKSTQWAVFEPNGPALWGNVRRMIEDFLLNEWQMGALLGDKPEKAYFVRCDRSTMTQNDLDNGRLVCLVGVAPLRPAEFVVFRIGQWTADRRA
ncbi:MAG TPA: phage tail sheath subtilisin-like domain-containing protein [Pyrinomonadaceae bacterium]|nr:phage tail sheath subtilisin-like domain-containing protein [Pyrinomonadaceae bacterium]